MRRRMLIGPVFRIHDKQRKQYTITLKVALIFDVSSSKENLRANRVVLDGCTM